MTHNTREGVEEVVATKFTTNRNEGIGPAIDRPLPRQIVTKRAYNTIIGLLQQELQKAREEERERVKRFLSLREASPQTDFDSDEEYQLHRQKIGAINWYANLIKGQIDLPDLPETNY